MRITSRRVAAAVASLVVGFALMPPVLSVVKRSLVRQELADVHGARELKFRRASRGLDRSEWPFTGLKLARSAEANRARLAWQAKMADYSAELRRNYERGAWRPWESRPPDPPRPAQP